MSGQPTQPVLFETLPTASGHRFGRATLNTPASLNALSLAMVDLLDPRLAAWAADPRIAGVVLDAAGDKAFCAGGDVVALARDLTRSWWPRARASHIDLGFDSALPALPVLANAALLREALTNLVHNALRYTPAGGHVTVTVQRADRAALLGVHDDGPGLEPDELPRASERFFRGRHARPGGTGLGLPIVRAVAERHGGTLELRNGADGRGFVARLRLPLHPADARKPAPTQGKP